MVHADASTFKSGQSKQEGYDQVLRGAEALFAGQRNWVCNLANTASLLWYLYASLPSPSSAVNWAGFYVLDRSIPAISPLSSKTLRKPPQQLILGPFMGKVACQTILFGRGVCGTAAERKRAVRVEDVEAFPGHIACDGASKSEIVVPVVREGQVVAIIDIDCAEKGGFDQVDEDNLRRLAALLANSCDWH